MKNLHITRTVSNRAAKPCAKRLSNSASALSTRPRPTKNASCARSLVAMSCRDHQDLPGPRHRSAKGATSEPAFNKLCRDAGRYVKIDMVMAWSVDRLGRSLQDLVGFLSELHAFKIDLFLRQQGLDTTTPAGKAMFQMMGVFAEFERAMIQERVRAGLARARSEGKRLGRPPIASALEKRIREALATPGRPGIRVIAERFGINPSTVQRISRLFDGASVAVA